MGRQYYGYDQYGYSGSSIYGAYTCQYCGVVVPAGSWHSCAVYPVKVAAQGALVAAQGASLPAGIPEPSVSQDSYPAQHRCCYCREVPLSPAQPELHVQCCMCGAVLATRFLDQIYTSSRHDLETELAFLEGASS